MILTVTMNPSVDIRYEMDKLEIDTTNRVQVAHKTAGGKGLNVARVIALSGRSVGASGMQSKFFENCVAEVMNLTGKYTELAVRRALKNSKVLSSDVSAAYDPNFPSVMEKKNSAYFGKGLVFNKYTGSRGKGGSNDANAEYIAQLRKVMDDNYV